MALLCAGAGAVSPAAHAYGSPERAHTSALVGDPAEASGAAIAEQVTEIAIPVSADTYVSDEEANRNFGNDETVLVAHRPKIGTSEEIEARGLLRFDLSPIPPGSTLSYARLEMYLLDAPRGSQQAIMVCATERAWSETGVTWNNQPIRTTSATCGGGAQLGTMLEVVSLDVGQIAEAWLSGTIPNYGLTLLPMLYEDATRVFESREHAAFWFRARFPPRLVIGYVPPPPMRGTISTDKSSYKDADPVTATYSLTDGPPTAHLRVWWKPQSGTFQLVKGDHEVVLHQTLTTSGRFTVADIPGGRFVLEGLHEGSWIELAGCSVTVEARHPATNPLRFGNTAIWAGSWTLEDDAWRGTGDVRLGSWATKRSYARTSSSIRVPYPESWPTSLSITGQLWWVGMDGGTEVPFATQQLHLYSEDCRLTGTFDGYIPVEGSAYVKVHPSAATTAFLCPIGSQQQEPGISGTGTIGLSFLPENQAPISLTFKVAESAAGSWTWSGTASNVHFKVAGGVLDADTVSLGNDGLTGSGIHVALPHVQSSRMDLGASILTIGLDGELSLRATSGEAGFTLPTVSLGTDYGVTIRDGRARLAQLGSAYELQLSACVDVSIPGSSTSLPGGCTVALAIRNGALQATLPTFAMPVAGQAMDLPSPALEHITGLSYRLKVAKATWHMPGDWGANAVIEVQDVEILTQPPYLRIGSLTANTTFALGGGSAADAAATFTVRNVEVELQGNRLQARIECDVTLRIGQSSTAALALILDNGSLRAEGAIGQPINGTLGGLKLTLTGVTYANLAFTAQTTRLELPPGWTADGAAEVALTDLTIGKDGVRFGSTSISLGTQKLGDVISFSQVQLEINGDESVAPGRRSYWLHMQACLDINLPVPGSGAATIDSDKCTASLDIRDKKVTNVHLPAFSMPVAGLAMRFASPGLSEWTGGSAGDEEGYRIYSDNVTWDLPVDWGTGSLALTQVEIFTAAPYLRVGGATGTLTINRPFGLGGAPASAVATFDVRTLEITYDGDLSVRFATSLTLRLGGESRADIVLLLKDRQLEMEGSIPELSAKLGGLQVMLRDVTYESQTFRVREAELELPPGWTGTDGTTGVRLAGLTVDKDGVAFDGAAIEVADQKLGDVITFASIKLAIQSSAGQGGQEYWLHLEACVDIDLPVPSGGSATIEGDSCTASMDIRDQKVTDVQLPAFSVPVAGLPMRFAKPGLGEWAGSAPAPAPGYRIYSDDVSWGLPPEWGTGTLQLTQVEIFTAEPYLRVGGAGGKITINRQFGLGGSPESAVAVFDVQTMEITFDGALKGRLATALTLRIGEESKADIVLLIADGKVALEGKASQIGAKLGGLKLTLRGVGYESETFRAGAAELALPKDWSGGTAAIQDVTIDKGGLKIGGASFTIPDQDFGGVVSLKDLRATLQSVPTGAATRLYRIDATGKVYVAADVSIAVEGTVHFHPDGKVNGEVSGFSLELVGFKLTVEKATFDRDHLYAERAGLELPAAFDVLKGRAAAYVAGLVIDRDGIRVKGGGFKLAFEAGAVSIAGSGNFEPDPNDRRRYIVAMDARAGTPEMDIEVAVTIGWRDPDVELRRIYVAIEGDPPNAPTVLLDTTTQLYGYKLEGEMVLTDQREMIAVSGSARTVGSFFGYYLMEVTGKVEVQWEPDFYLLVVGDAKMLGRDVAEASIRLAADSIWIAGKLEASEGPAKVKAALDAAIGMDTDQELTMMADIRVTLYIKEDAVCWGVPWSDIELAQADATIGKHRHDGRKMWGVRGSAKIKGIGRGYAWIGFSPKGWKVGKGSGRNSFAPIWPKGVNPATMTAGPHAAAAELAMLSGSLLSDDPPPHGEFDIVAADDFLAVEYLPPTVGFDVPTVTFTQPDGAQLSPPVEATSAEHNTRYYLIDSPQPGRWQVDAVEGAYVMVLGSDPAPVVDAATVVRSGGGFRLDWQVTLPPDAAADVWLQAKASDGAGQYLVFAEGLPPSGNTTWMPARLAADRYDVELVVDDGLHTVVHDVATIDWVDSTPPAAPSGLTANALGDGTLVVSWVPPSDADVAGYEVTLGDGHPLRRMGRERTTYETTGFNPGDTVDVSVTAVDISGNVGPVATTSASWPAQGVMVQDWQPRDQDWRVSPPISEVAIRFRDTVTIEQFTVLGPDGSALAGWWERSTITMSEGVSLPIGARWVAETPATKPGRYSARVTGRDATGAPVGASWTWAIPPQEPVWGWPIYLPVARQSGRPELPSPERR